jgi:NTP pyrophosphatase (non-canonical NTP hydrolase)
MKTPNAWSEVASERLRQDAKWGEQNHNPAMWLAILTEEVGEVAQAVCKAWVPPYTDDQIEWLFRYRDELVHVAAVAVAAIESFDRNESKTS